MTPRRARGRRGFDIARLRRVLERQEQTRLDEAANVENVTMSETPTPSNTEHPRARPWKLCRGVTAEERRGLTHALRNAEGDMVAAFASEGQARVFADVWASNVERGHALTSASVTLAMNAKHATETLALVDAARFPKRSHNAEGTT